MDNNQYLELFIEESKENLQKLNDLILKLEKQPTDIKIINEVFRVAHTLKGMAGTMGFNHMMNLTHKIEDLFDSVRNNKLEINSSIIDLLLRSFDELGTHLNYIISNGQEGELQDKDVITNLISIIEDNKIKGITNTTSDSVEHIAINEDDNELISKFLNEGKKIFEVTVTLNEKCMLKSARAFLVFQTIQMFSDIIKSEPDNFMEAEEFNLEFTVLIATKETDKFIKDGLMSISEVENVIVKDYKPSFKHKLQDDNNEKLKKEEKNIVSKFKANKTVRVDIEKLDELMNLVSELIITKTRLDGIKNTNEAMKYTETIEYLERITTNLHDAVMKTRMVPIESIFNRFPRLIRDTAKDLGKDISFKISGQETELDRVVIDELSDPLMHLLRNSIDHGIENSSERDKLGKPKEGHISLRAYQEGNNVVIEVADDGRGINLKKIKNLIVEKELIKEELIETLSESEILNFIFTPNFSTANKITDLSGRGVGLDVVKTKIESLGGIVETSTQEGYGTKFTIKLPLTLSIIQALLVYVGNERYAIPLSTIEEIVDIDMSGIKKVQKQEVILLRNHLIPILRLEERFNVEKSLSDSKRVTAVIIKQRDKSIALIVNSLIGQQEIVVKSLGKLILGIKGISGATILGDGDVALIIDVNSI